MKRVYNYFHKRPYWPPLILGAAGIVAVIFFSFQAHLDEKAILLTILGSFSLFLIYVGCLHVKRQIFLPPPPLPSTHTPLEHKSDGDIDPMQKKDQQLEEVIKLLKETQRNLAVQEKMASIGMLAAGISHEIKNPLNFINNFSDTVVEMVQELKEEIEKIPAKTEESANLINEIIEDISITCRKIGEHGKRAESIVKNMLIQSRSDDSQIMPTNLNALLDEYLNLAYHGLRAQNNKFNAKFEKHLDPHLQDLKVFPQSIGRVFLNIINNGIYAANEKATQLENSALNPPFMPTITITTEQNDSHVIIKIKDNGNGIPTQLAEKIFEPFFTTKPIGYGTGLGLPLCYDIIQEHGGELTFDTKIGEYTEFIITLPKNKDNSAIM